MKSPLKVVKIKNKILGTIYRWKCDPRFRGARLEHRTIPGLFAMIHRSTKRIGGWQTTYFDRDVPTADIQSDTCDEAVSDLGPRRWKLKEVY